MALEYCGAGCGKLAILLLGCRTCKQTYYCSIECRVKDWEPHKKACSADALEAGRFDLMDLINANPGDFCVDVERLNRINYFPLTAHYENLKGKDNPKSKDSYHSNDFKLEKREVLCYPGTVESTKGSVRHMLIGVGDDKHENNTKWMDLHKGGPCPAPPFW